MDELTLANFAEKTAALLQVISPAPRLTILLAIGRGEACVCHLESILGWRQAYISQHLMALRKAELLLDRRAGRYVYYRLRDVELLTLLQDAATLSGLPSRSVALLANPQPGEACECPHCTPQVVLLMPDGQVVK
jgi:DNA-binding transcriptional ArsR family regulator